MAAHYVVRDTMPGRVVEAWSERRLPFEPKGWLQEFRSELRAALGRLSARHHESLHAIYSSPIRDRCDVENVSLYNVGAGAFSALASAGLRFERGYRPASTPDGVAWSHHYRYSLEPLGGGFVSWAHGQRLADWVDARCPPIRAETKPAVLWLAVKRAMVDLAAALEPPPAKFLISIRIATPRGVGGNVAAFLKPLIDGTLAAFHSHARDSTLQLIAERLGATLGLGPAEVAARLVDPRIAVLGGVELAWPWRTGVQWNPSDDRCVGGEVFVDRVLAPGSDWSFAGQLVEAVPRPVGHSVSS